MTRSASSTYDDDFFAWTQEQAAAFRRLPPDAALAAFTPSMRRLMDPDKIWQRGRKHAQRYFEEAGSPLISAVRCPFCIDDLLAEDFDLDAALTKMAAARAADGRS